MLGGVVKEIELTWCPMSNCGQTTRLDLHGRADGIVDVIYRNARNSCTWLQFTVDSEIWHLADASH